MGTFSVFFDLSTGLGATIVGLVVSLSGERGGFAVAGALARRVWPPRRVLRDRIGRRHLQPVPATGSEQAA